MQVITRRIAFINEKGGSGKTTLVANLAAYLASRRGRRVLAIDMDPQAQLGKVLGLEVRRPRRSAIELLVDGMLDGPDSNPRQNAHAGVHGAAHEPQSLLPSVTTRIPHLDIIVSNKSLALFPAWTQHPLAEAGERPPIPDDSNAAPRSGAADEDPTLRLRRRFDEARDELAQYDYVLVDAPPSFGPLTLNILRACDEVVVPVPLTYLALDGCAELMRTISLVRSRYHHEGLRLTMVVPTFHRRTRLAGEILQKLEARFPKELAQTIVGYNVKVDEAQSRGLSIFEYAPRDRGAIAMAALAEELDSRAPIATRPLNVGSAPEPVPLD